MDDAGQSSAGSIHGYYALFHLLIQDVSSHWRGEKNSRAGLSRAFEHSEMERASRAFGKSTWQGFDGVNVSIPPELRDIALVFVTLQEWRHRADYNYSARFFRSNVLEQIAEAQDAFKEGGAIRSREVADYYLMALLTGNRKRD